MSGPVLTPILFIVLVLAVCFLPSMLIDWVDERQETAERARHAEERRIVEKAWRIKRELDAHAFAIHLEMVRAASNTANRKRPQP